MGCKINKNSYKVDTNELESGKAKEIISVQDVVDYDDSFCCEVFRAAFKYCATYASGDDSTPEEITRSLDNLHHCFDQFVH